MEKVVSDFPVITKTIIPFVIIIITLKVIALIQDLLICSLNF